MSGPVTKRKCLTAMLKMSHNKFPSLDAFDVEFYKIFWNVLNDLLLRSYEFLYYPVFSLIHNAKSLLFSYLNAIKTIITIELYRPITLFNIDCKMIATVINSRTKCYLNELIRPG